jgi:hypothetical protein
MISFVRPFEEKLEPAKVRTSISRRSDSYLIDLETNVPTRFIELSFRGQEGWFDDNYFHLSPDSPKRIHFYTDSEMENPEEFLEIRFLNPK